MKKVMLLASVMGISSIAMAQKGSWYVGGNVGFATSQNKWKSNGTTTDDGKTTNWSFSPEVGTFLTDNWQLGVGLSISGSKNDPQTEGNTINKSTSYGGTVYTRYFFGNGAFRPFLGANVKVLPGTATYTYNGTDSKYNTLDWGANANAGFGYGISKKVTLVGALGFLGFSRQTAKSKSSDTKSTTNNFGFNANTLGNPFTIGIYFTL